MRGLSGAGYGSCMSFAARLQGRHDPPKIPPMKNPHTTPLNTRDMSAVLRDSTKGLLWSKTVWLQVIVVMLFAIPQVRAWCEENVGVFAAGWAVANVALRLVTREGVRVFPEEEIDFIEQEILGFPGNREEPAEGKGTPPAREKRTHANRDAMLPVWALWLGAAVVGGIATAALSGCGALREVPFTASGSYAGDGVTVTGGYSSKRGIVMDVRHERRQVQGTK